MSINQSDNKRKKMQINKIRHQKSSSVTDSHDTHKIIISYYEHEHSEEQDIQEELKESLKAYCLPKLSP